MIGNINLTRICLIIKLVHIFFLIINLIVNDGIESKKGTSIYYIFRVLQVMLIFLTKKLQQIVAEPNYLYYSIILYIILYICIKYYIRLELRYKTHIIGQWYDIKKARIN